MLLGRVIFMSIDDRDLRGKLIDHSIEYDYSKLPKSLIELIQELEDYDKLGDWFNYDIKFDMLEIFAKNYANHNIISDVEYQTILHKYGGLYDVDV